MYGLPNDHNQLAEGNTVKVPLEERRRRRLLAVENFQQLGELLKTSRLERGMKLEEVAESIDVDATTLSRIENGKRIPSKILCEGLAKQYDLPSVHLTHVVRCLKDASSPVENFLGLIKEIKTKVQTGKLSMDAAEEIVTAWETVMGIGKESTLIKGGPQNVLQNMPGRPVSESSSMYRPMRSGRSAGRRHRRPH